MFSEKIFRLFLLIISILVFVSMLSACTKDEVGIEGRWKGAIIINEEELNIYVDFKETEEGLEATIDIPQQNIENYALQNITYDHPEISFVLPSGTPGKFKGEKDGTEITGEYTQGQFNGEFYLNKTDEESSLVKEEEEIENENSKEIKLDVEEGIIYGTLTLPENNENNIPVVLIIAGSGPTDRNGNSAIAGNNNNLKMIAEQLATHNIASLRYDKRGIAKSANVDIAEKDLRFEDYINDAIGWLGLLKKDQRFSDVFILGHSQGSLVGMVAAQEEDIAGFISVAGPGQFIADTLREQLSTLPAELKEEAEEILASLENGKTVSEVDENLQSVFRPSVQPFLISYMKYDPVEEIKKLDIPILIVQGTTDLQVSVSDANNLKDAFPEAQLEIIEGMNHVLKEAPADPQKNTATYNDPELPLADGFTGVILDFIKHPSQPSA